MKSGIYLVATPIGNLSDITLRAIETLKSAEVIACEDTRVSKKLFSLLGISTKEKIFITMEDHHESETSKNVIDYALQGKIVAYISDAGSPLISDPGYKLVVSARRQNVYITTVPGACAAVCAMQLSGLPSDKFMFVGFIPNKDKARLDLLQKYAFLDASLIFYETANRLDKTLLAMQKVFGSRKISVVREISKLYEDCQSGSAQELSDYFSDFPPKGEIVIIVAPNTEVIIKDYTAELKQELKNNTLKQAVKNIVEKFNANKNEVYKKALELKDEL